MFLSFIISGLPFAISKMVAESNSRGEYSKNSQNSENFNNIACVYRHCRKCRALFRLTVFALAMKEEKAIYAIQMIAPSIFFVALGTAYKVLSRCFKYDTDRTFTSNRSDC
mgnify:CR=1 FL=1